MKWPIQWKSLFFTLFINDREVKKATTKNTDKGGKWKDNFIRPIGEEGEGFGASQAFEHKLVENVTDNDKVAIKFEMEFSE